MRFILLLIVFLYISSVVGSFFYMFFQKNYFYYITKKNLKITFLIHTFLLIYHGIEYKAFPVNNLYGILLVGAWSVIAAFFLVQYLYRLKMLVIYATSISSIIMIVALNTPKILLHDIRVFKSIWLGIHVVTVFLADSFFGLACAAGILYIIQENGIKNKRRGFFFDRLPSLEFLDDTLYACIVIGFSLLTIGLISGGIYANFVWGYYWSWDPKEICSAITWFFYVVLLYKRLIIRLKGRRLAIMAIMGFGMLIFTLFGVNFLLKGHHGVFTSM